MASYFNEPDGAGSGVEWRGLGSGITRNHVAGDFQSNGTVNGTTQLVNKCWSSAFTTSKIIPGRSMPAHSGQRFMSIHSLTPIPPPTSQIEVARR
jgi:hypothetical protein